MSPTGLSTPIRVGLVGCGNIALGYHLPAYRALSDLVRVVAVADPTLERRTAAGALLGLAPGDIHDDPDQLVERADVDVVDVSTPPHVRIPVSMRALEAGKTVLCEKPLATVPREAADLVLASARLGLPVGLVHNYLFLPEIELIGAIIEAGEIGQPEVAMLNYLGVDDRPGAAAYRPGWRHDPALAGGGVLMDMMHALYLAEALLGAIARRVSAHVGARQPGAPVEDIALCRLETDRGVALVNVGWGAGPGGIVVSGPDGRIEIRYAGGGTAPFAPLEEVRVVHRDGTSRTAMSPSPRATDAPIVDLTPTLRDFFERLASGRAPLVAAEDGLHVLEATLAAYESAALARTVALPLRRDDPLYLHGLPGIRELDIDPSNPMIRRSLFGLHTPDEREA